MKKRVSLLLSVLLAFALVFALSSCDEEHEHVRGEAAIENRVPGNCSVEETYDEVYRCTTCGEVIETKHIVGKFGDHVSSAPVLENVDVVNCEDGGHADEVVYCSVESCGKEISRTQKTIESVDHVIVTDTEKTYTSDLCTKGGLAYTVEHCENCEYVKSSTLSGPITKADHDFFQNVCRNCSAVLGTKGLEYELNPDKKSYTVNGIGSATSANLMIGLHPDDKLPVTKIKEGAFENASKVRRLTIGACVEEIGENAFLGCSFDTLYIYNLAAWCEIDFANDAANPIGVSKAFALNKNELIGVLAIPEGVTAISEYAFANIKKIHTVYLNGVQNVSENAFAGCSDLKNVRVTDSLKSVGKDAFLGCELITNVYADSLVGWIGIDFASEKATPLYYAENYYVANKIVDGELSIPETVETISDYAFFSLNISSLKIPASVKYIKSNAFANCKALKSITMENGVTEIGAYAFWGCSALTEIDLSDALGTIGKQAFENCTALETVVFDAALESIGEAAFKGCTALTKVELVGNVKTVAKEAFYGCSAIKTLTLNENLESIGASAFENCVKISAVTVPTTVKTVDFAAFAGCTALESITVPFVGNKLGVAENSHFGYIFGAKAPLATDTGKNNLQAVPYLLTNVVITGSEAITEYAFAGCESIVSVSVPESVTAMGAYAFDGCTALREVRFPDLAKWCVIDFANYSANPLANAGNLYIDGLLLESAVIDANVKNISAYAFYGATSITEFVIEGVVTIGNDAFAYCSALNTISLPSTLTKVGARAFAKCEALETVNVSNIAKWCEIDFVDYLSSPFSYASNLYVNGAQVTELVIPESVAKISARAFSGITTLTAVTLSANLTEIGFGAFAGCTSLKSIAVPSGVKNIGSEAFLGCSELAAADLGSVEKISDKAFFGCVSLAAVVVPNTVTVIGNEAFSGCEALASVTLGSAVESIGISAFYGCTALTEISVPASVTYIGAYAMHACVALDSVTFANAEGWQANGVAVAENTLLDAALAADALTGDLGEYDWKRAE